MTNPGAFQEIRRDFLISQKPIYETAIALGHVLDAITLIQRKYFKRFPPNIPHDVDPSPEHLASVDDNEPDPD
ncbi:hypothetical protein BJ165DRAFT_1323395, partial [Panaeolus papilionaceus]